MRGSVAAPSVRSRAKGSRSIASSKATRSGGPGEVSTQPIGAIRCQVVHNRSLILIDCRTRRLLEACNGGMIKSSVDFLYVDEVQDNLILDIASKAELLKASHARLISDDSTQAPVPRSSRDLLRGRYRANHLRRKFVSLLRLERIHSSVGGQFSPKCNHVRAHD